MLAVLAAVSSGQYANQFSRTILKQAEASDEWSYFQAKSIKRHIVAGQVELLRAMTITDPQAAPALKKLDYLYRGLNELLFFELFTAGEAVDRREEIELHQRLNQIIRDRGGTVRTHVMVAEPGDASEEAV